MTQTPTRIGDTASATWTALGCRVELVVTDRRALTIATDVLAYELAALDLACSRFRVDSELMLLQAARGRPVAVSPLFAAALRAAITAAEQTGGLVDPTVAPSLAAFGYDRDFDQLPPDGPAPVPPLASEATWRDIELDLAGEVVSLPPGLQLDLGATAKAFAADRAALLISQVCECGVLVSLGGDVALAGPPPDQGGWSIRVQESPGVVADAALGSSCGVALVGGGLATSSTRHRRWRRAGRAYHHIIDPRTGRPAQSPWRTVSVAAASCVAANTASTAAIILGAAAPPWLHARKLPSRLVDGSDTVQILNGWPEEPT